MHNSAAMFARLRHPTVDTMLFYKDTCACKRPCVSFTAALEHGATSPHVVNHAWPALKKAEQSQNVGDRLSVCIMYRNPLPSTQTLSMRRTHSQQADAASGKDVFMHHVKSSGLLPAAAARACMGLLH